MASCPKEKRRLWNQTTSHNLEWRKCDRLRVLANYFDASFFFHLRVMSYMADVHEVMETTADLSGV